MFLDTRMSPYYHTVKDLLKYVSNQIMSSLKAGHAELAHCISQMTSAMPETQKALNETSVKSVSGFSQKGAEIKTYPDGCPLASGDVFRVPFCGRQLQSINPRYTTVIPTQYLKN